MTTVDGDERVERKDGAVVWRVRWRQGGRNRSKVLGRKRDAEAFDADLVRRKRTGELAQLDAGKESLAAFGEEWWRLYGEPNLARSTLQVYAVQWDAHVLPRLGSFYYSGPSPARVGGPKLGAPYYELRFRNGYVTGIVATRRLDRFLSYGVYLERFARNRWYAITPQVSEELRRVTAGLRPLRLTRAALAKSR